MMIWVSLHHTCTPEHLGILPSFFDERDPRRAAEQLNANYQHGGGWHPYGPWTMLADGNLLYPGDPPLIALCETKLRDETIRLYQHQIVAIIQKDGAFEVDRVD